MARFLCTLTGMDTLAVTVWNGIVSPVFDAAGTYLIAREDGGREQLDLGGDPWPRRIEALRERNVQCLICGAISNVPMLTLNRHGIRVIAWIRGPVEEVIAAYWKGRLPAETYLMPGCSRGMCPGRTTRRCRGGVRRAATPS